MNLLVLINAKIALDFQRREQFFSYGLLLAFNISLISEPHASIECKGAERG